MSLKCPLKCGAEYMSPGKDELCWLGIREKKVDRDMVSHRSSKSAVLFLTRTQPACCHAPACKDIAQEFSSGIRVSLNWPPAG